MSYSNNKLQMKSFDPLVSVVIPVYNGSNYLAEAIKSVLAQTYSNIEIVVVNDGSDDEGKTERIALSYGKKITYYYKENGGAATALNYGIQKMKGEYFSWLSHDDLYKPRKIELQVRYLETLPDKATILYGGYQNFDKEHGVYDTLDFSTIYTNEQLETPLFPVLHLALNGCTLLIHRSHFDRVGGFDPTLPTTQDYDLWFRMFRGQSAHCLPGCQVLSRSHPAQGSKALLDTHLLECEGLWERVFTSLTDKEMTDLGGSLYDFYRDEYVLFSRTTEYPKTIAYLRGKALQELSMLRSLNDDFYNDVYRKIKVVSGAASISKAVHQRKAAKRIAFFLGDVNDLGGLNRIVLRTASELTQFYDVWLIDTLKYDGSGYIMSDLIHEVTVQWNVQEIVDIVQILQIDVFIGSYNCLNFQLQLYNMLEKAPVKIIAWNHEHYFLPYLKKEFHYLLCYRMETLKHVNAIVFLTSLTCAMYDVHGSNSIVIPNMISFDENTESQATQASAGNTTLALENRYNVVSKKQKKQKPAWSGKYIISVGRFDDPLKGLESLIKAFAMIRKKLPNYRLLVVGSYDLDMRVCIRKDFLKGDIYRTIHELIEESNLPKDSIVFTGMVKNVNDYYKKAELNLFTSACEGFGLVITEAAYYGIPTIAFTKNGSEDIIADGETGYIVETAEEMGKAAIKLLSTPAQLSKMKEAARKRLNLFSAQRITLQWKRLLDRLISESPEQFRQNLIQENVKHRKLTAEEYRWYITQMDLYYHSSKVSSAGPSAPTVITNPFWEERCKQMEKTFSWRITKPLRAIRGAELNVKAKFRKKK